jgi:hypothetical protein
MTERQLMKNLIRGAIAATGIAGALLFAVAGTAGAATSGSAPAPCAPSASSPTTCASAQPTGQRTATPGYLWTNNGHPTTFALHAHSAGGQLTVASSGLQKWVATDPQPWSGVTAFQVQLSGTSLCATWSSVSGGMYAQTCQNDNSHPGQLFDWASDGNGGYYLINELASIDNLADVFMTARSNSNNSVVDGEFAGAGGRAQWAFVL